MFLEPTFPNKSIVGLREESLNGLGKVALNVVHERRDMLTVPSDDQVVVVAHENVGTDLHMVESLCPG